MAADKDKPRGRGAGKRKVGAVVMQRRGAQARIKTALAPEIEDGPDAAAGVALKKRISRLTRRTKALVARLKPGTTPRPPRKPRPK